MGLAQVDNPGMEPIGRRRAAVARGRWARPAAAALGLAGLAACLAMPARATPGTPGPTSLAEAARLQQEVASLDVRVGTLAEAHAAAQSRLEGLIQAAHRHQADLERSELALQATRAEYAGDVRDLYARDRWRRWSCCWPPATSTSWPWPPARPGWRRPGGQALPVGATAPATWCSGPTTRPTRRPSTTSACTSARA
jgi:hypothetical protein